MEDLSEKTMEELRAIEQEVQGHISARESKEMLPAQITSLIDMYIKGGGKLEELNLPTPTDTEVL